MFEASGQQAAERERESERLLSNGEERGVEEFGAGDLRSWGEEKTRNRGSQERRLRGQ